MWEDPSSYRQPELPPWRERRMLGLAAARRALAEARDQAEDGSSSGSDSAESEPGRARR